MIPPTFYNSSGQPSASIKRLVSRAGNFERLRKFITKGLKTRFMIRAVILPLFVGAFIGAVSNCTDEQPNFQQTLSGQPGMQCCDMDGSAQPGSKPLEDEDAGNMINPLQILSPVVQFPIFSIPFEGGEAVFQNK